MQMSGQGAKAWEELTGKAYTQKSNIAIVLDNVVYSAPGVSTGPISGGRSEISGNFDISETKDLIGTEKIISDAMTKEYMRWTKQLPPFKWYPIGKTDKEEE